MEKKKKGNEMNFSQIVDEAAIILQRKSDNVMTIKQVANYLGISVGAVRKRCQRNQLPYHRVITGTDTVLKTKLFGLKVRHFNNSCLLIAFTRSIHALFSM